MLKHSPHQCLLFSFNYYLYLMQLGVQLGGYSSFYCNSLMVTPRKRQVSRALVRVGSDPRGDSRPGARYSSTNWFSQLQLGTGCSGNIFKFVNAVKKDFLSAIVPQFSFSLSIFRVWLHPTPTSLQTFCSPALCIADATGAEGLGPAHTLTLTLSLAVCSVIQAVASHKCGCSSLLIESTPELKSSVGCFCSRHYKEAKIHINVYIVNEPWLFSLAWCYKINSVTTDNIQTLNQLSRPLFFMVSCLSRSL